MSRRWLSAVAGLAAAAAMAGTAFANTPRVLHVTGVKSVVPVKTIPIRDMRNLNMPAILRRIIGNRDYTQQEIAKLREKLIEAGYLKSKAPYQIPLKVRTPHGGPVPQVANTHLQTKIGQRKDFTVGVTFPGIGTSDNPPDSIGCAPPDTNAAVGSGYVVEIVNLCDGSGGGYFKVWDTSGNQVQGTTPLGALWSSNTDCQYGNGDNQVIYDQFANRWILSQFNSTITGICVAVSTSSDPTGTYNLYDFSIDSSGFTDYPKIGVWVTGDDNSDAYFVTDNDFTSPFQVNFTALQRSAMLTGGTAEEIVANDSSSNAQSVLPADVDGMTMPPLDDPEVFANYTSPFSTGSGYQLNLWQMSVDWSSDTGTLTGPTALTVGSFNDGICDYSRACIPQPSGGEGLDALGDRVMFRLAYRNGNSSTSDQVLLVNNTVGTGSAPSSPPSGIEWYQLDAPSGSTGVGDWSVKQQGTYMPDDGNSRWMGSIAMDHVGDLGMVFSESSSSLDPSVEVTGQNVGAASGVMDAGESTLVSGGGVQESTFNRWGDYASIMTDPADDCTFWTAEEYISETGSFLWSTNIGSFKFSGCSIGPIGTLTGTITDANSGNPINGANVNLTPGNHSGSSNSSGVYTVTAPATTGGPTTYTAAATAFGYQESDATVQITDGGTTTQDFSLTPAPTATLGGKVTDAGHHYPLYAEVKVAYNSKTVADVWTNPLTGIYRTTLPQASGYAVTVTPYLAGFTAGSATVDIAGNTRQDFALTPDSSCSAPGYGLGKALNQDFDGGTFPPSGWVVATGQNNGFTHWQPNTAYQDGNYTNGGNVAADAEDNRGGPGLGAYSTSLISPPIAVTALSGGTTLAYTANYQDYPDYSDALDLDISTDGGNTWTNITSWNTSADDCGSLYSTPGCNVSMDIGSFLPASGTFRLRWHYYDYNPNAWDWYAQVDNVSLGTTSCNAIPGDLLAMTATDANTRQLLSGVSITDENGNSVTTHPIPNLDNKTGAFMFESTGQHTLTASLSGYQDKVIHKGLTAGNTVHLNFALGAGRLVTSPATLTVDAPVNATTTVTLTIGNTGTAAADWKLSSIDAPPLKPLEGGPVGKDRGINCPNPATAKSLVLTKGDGGCGPDRPAPKVNDAAWSQLATYPGNRADACAAKDETGTGLLYTFGGYSAGASPSTFVYDPSSDTWTQLADMPKGLEKPACAFINGKAYVTAGWDNSGNSNQGLYIYDPASNTWTQGPDDPAAQAGGPGVAVLQGQKFYVITGCKDGFCSGTSAVEVYDPGSSTWSAAADYPHVDGWPSCGGIAGKVYCFGGTENTDFKYYQDGYVYDPGSNSWSQVADLPVNSWGCQDNWGSAYTNTIGGQLVIAQGVTCNGFDIEQDAFAYDAASNTWSTLPEALVADYRMASACGFYSVGGELNPSFAEVLSPGYDVCNVGPVPWLSFNPVSGTLNARNQTTVTLTIDGTGQPPRTSTTVQVVLNNNTPYGSIIIPLQVNWTFGGKPTHK